MTLKLQNPCRRSTIHFIVLVSKTLPQIIIKKVPISSKFLFSHLILHFMQGTSAKKCFDLDKKQFFLWTFKNLKILFSCGWPAPLITASTCSELWRRFRNVRLQALLISIVLPLQILLRSPCSFPAFCMNY